jgi:acyl-CoA synthetase (AMP-forming)/AMP-acid ligase II
LCNIAKAHDEVLLLRTSGTTSKSKLVPLTNNSVVANGSIIAESLGITNSDIALNAMPLFHIGGLSANILAPLSVGGATILVSSFNVIDFVDIIENGKPYEPSQNYKKLHYDEEDKDDEETAIKKIKIKIMQFLPCTLQLLNIFLIEVQV